MRKVLIAASHPVFRDFLKQKLSENNIEVTLTQENRDYYTKMIVTLPQLIILDMDDDNSAELEFLEKKIEDSNAITIPVIVAGPSQDKTNITALAKYGVVKYFEKPIQFDVFFEAIGNFLHVPLTMDSTPCVLDIHRNGKIIFVEIALGLNRDKIALLNNKLSEMIVQERIDYPKIILLLSNLEFTFVDGYNLEFLINQVIKCPNIQNKNIKILSLSPFVKEFLFGHKEYAEIEMSSNLSKILTSLVDTTITSSVSDLISDRILSESYSENTSLIETRFAADVNGEVHGRDGTILNIAIIDSSLPDLGLNQLIFSEIGAKTKGYSSSQEFIKDYPNEKFNLIILDVVLADQTGISLLEYLQRQKNTTPILIYSPLLPKDVIIRLSKLGIADYLTKPAKNQNILIQRALKLLMGTE